jgi:DNA-binding XRE family transcriptional regulator
MSKEALQEVKIGGRTFCLVPKAQYTRLLHDAEGPVVDAVQFGRKSIGRDLRKKRLELHLTQAQVAAKAKVRVETVSRVESGDTNPTMKTMAKILRAVGVKV